MLIVDHIRTQRDGGDHSLDNVQTLCLDCNQIKSTLACDTMPKALYKDENEFNNVKENLKPWLDKLFN
jgi:5-methylcytosine-specific restriction endonuclease McrA